jgi:hypothetical protein
MAAMEYRPSLSGTQDNHVIACICKTLESMMEFRTLVEQSESEPFRGLAERGRQ